jgi:hypothetical protein
VTRPLASAVLALLAARPDLADRPYVGAVLAEGTLWNA